MKCKALRSDICNMKVRNLFTSMFQLDLKIKSQLFEVIDFFN